MYATHRHDLFYITVKYHQIIPNGIKVIERTRKCLRTDGRADRRRTDARLIAISPELFGREDKKQTNKKQGDMWQFQLYYQDIEFYLSVISH